MNNLMQQERTLQEESTNKLKEELAEAQAAVQNQPIPPSNSDLINRLNEEVKAAEETNAKQTSYVQKLSDEKQHMQTEAKEYSKHCVQYVRDIAGLQKAKEDPEKAKEQAYSSISDQNEMVK